MMQMADSLDLWGENSNTTDWLASLEAHDVQYLILDVQGDAELLRQVCHQPGWRVDFNDGDSAICIRNVQTLLRRGES